MRKTKLITGHKLILQKTWRPTLKRIVLSAVIEYIKIVPISNIAIAERNSANKSVFPKTSTLVSRGNVTAAQKISTFTLWRPVNADTYIAEMIAKTWTTNATKPPVEFLVKGRLHRINTITPAPASPFTVSTKERKTMSFKTKKTTEIKGFPTWATPAI